MADNEIITIVKQAIEKIGTNKDLATLLRVSRCTVSRWVHGVQKPTAQNIIAMIAIIKKGKK